MNKHYTIYTLMNKHYTIYQKIEIILLFKANYSNREIGEKLLFPQSSVAKIIKEYKDYNTLDHPKKNGRPAMLENTPKNYILKENNFNNKIYCRKLAEKL
ncbi:hypothetical protein DMUE_4509 [Dictyocoela muelleri]|nr:hypothetical protein DMUE_4509 [Dictyocoela muelleri]